MAQIDANLSPSETEFWLFGTHLGTNWWDDVSWLTSDCWAGESQLDRDSHMVHSAQFTSDKAPVLCEFPKDKIAKVSSETVRKRFYCNFSRCPKSYSRAEHVRRHINEGHSTNPPRYFCMLCGHCFVRLENLRAHRKLHRQRDATGGV
ncbi:uncharacterized protein F5Z01DRAFT_467400 [Emericellopsis atlantica]|uniref:C2H2-type domain-containing protein n=1 Tax=Emericellopsis atlantica TaxID=2614577 RepID=A0A9P8CK60_9HYPO|nr:uncharacterized protein F5Z01DRAFT_467400 [Emericellopsis atlantica]KAG9249717.1 hypothetical protein F5Z01DRAFT_467400 [Emericellopsis atlantica]